MNKKVLHTLEYDKIINLLKEEATTEYGKQLCERLVPLTDPEKIKLLQQQTADSLSRIFKYGSVSFCGAHDISDSLKRLEIGSSLSISELLRICSLLETAKRAKSYGRQREEDAAGDSLDEFFDKIEPLTPLCEEIRRCILSEEEISDNASPRLKSIRRKMDAANARIHSQMTEMLNRSDVRNHLRDNVVTMRNGRYCLPVKSDSKSLVPGMVHDQSSTGSTLFIEPMSVVKLNNELRELYLKEQEEIEIILSTLSNLAAEYIPYLQDDFKVLTQLDFIFARGMLAMNMNASKPEFQEGQKIRIRNGRHPLLELSLKNARENGKKKKVVPVNIELGDTFNQLIITGPNTGGKTVSLKTAGLFTLMGQAGLHIPADDRSVLSVFQEVYADIGDEQSIEQSLSTFSSHMTNIVSILEQADACSLVLFDELCAGTDPTEGAALATAILTKLHTRNILTMATTHYSEIKVYALSTKGVENACCEFDLATLSPTYRLLIGIPGKSNAFAISGKLGLSEAIIKEARNHITEAEVNFEDLISDLETSRATIEAERLEIQEYKEEIARLKKKLETKQDNIEAQKERVLREANEQAHKVLAEAKELADKTIRNFNKYSASNPNIRQMEKERSALRDKMSEAEKNISQKTNSAANHKAPKSLRIGDSVKVLSLNLTGTVHTLPNAKGELYVQMGILRSLVNINDLVLIEEAPVAGTKNHKTNAGKLRMSKSASVSAEINLLGKTTDEAIALLDKYLDDAYIAHLPSVRIVHGKGTGALRQAVANHLKRLSYIKSYRLGAFGEGDSGVTIAEFRS
ncbi:MAG: endonuclease MutS2 [Eubacterium sp.]|nr:endonuclease MutS2 [Eubacterium sp.]